jgi:hypothetical protein
MTTSLPWWEDLERLREEQKPNPSQQPFLRLPVPVPTMPMKDIRVTNPEDDSEDRGVVYLDM